MRRGGVLTDSDHQLLALWAATCAEHVLGLFEATLSAKRPVCTIAMGEIGAHSRIIAPVYGSLLTYGYVRKPVAPGQMRVDQVLEGLRLLGLR